MASFFQPPEDDPSIRGCGPSRFEIYCNSVIPNSDRWRTTHQVVTFFIAVAALGVPVVYWSTRHSLTLIVSKILRRPRDPTREPPRKPRRGEDNRYTGKFVNVPALKTVTSFHILSDDVLRSQELDASSFGLVFVPIHPIAKGKTAEQVRARGSVVPESLAGPVAFAYVDTEAFAPSNLSDDGLEKTADLLAAVFETNSLDGIAIRCTTSKPSENLPALFAALSRRSVPLIAIGNNDAPALDIVNYAHLVGVVVENGLTLSTGDRRDYFRSVRTRAVMAKCASQRELRPDFFVGFWDLWEQRPTPALVRRAVKLSEHFGAVYEHGATGATRDQWGETPKATATLSGFEYIRKPECTDVLKIWSLEKKPVSLPSGSPSAAGNARSSTTACFPASSLDRILPGASGLLDLHPLPVQLVAALAERPTRVAPPDYAGAAPGRYHFWDVSQDEADLSTWGCFPLTSVPTKEQYDAVVRVQVHLRELQMLHPLKGIDTHKIRQRLEALVDVTEYEEMVQSLIDGLAANTVHIFKGLDTGFAIPDDGSRFWAVSTPRDEQAGLPDVDIYVSQKSPWDAGAVLHTWLAHHGVAREQRYEEELRLEQANRMDTPYGIPAGLRACIERSTTAELLFMLEQMRVAELDHPYRGGMAEMAREVLVGDAKRAAWKHEHSQRWLEGSASMEELLERRLEDLARRGAARLPLLENLVVLFEAVEDLIEDALFMGDRESIIAMNDALAGCFALDGTTTTIDVAADLFALIFFGVLRRAALEDVYVEATDRCPYFLSQPDQAAVFAELWVLGSQCEIYFCILPREVGLIVFNDYQAFLDANPPTEDFFAGSDIMTMYSNAQAPAPDPDEKLHDGSPAKHGMTSRETARLWKKRVLDFGALSIFCLPAIVDVVLLTFLGRGLFMTAFMTGDQLTASGYGLLIGLLLTAGVTGWVGSIGNYYIAHYAYDNMIFFHVQRLSGGFVLTGVVALGGWIGFAVHRSFGTGFLFVAYLLLMTTYFNLLGIMATMHQQGSPLTSGRTVLWRTFPVLFISPIVSTFVPGHDLQIYMPVSYLFLALMVYQYRNLCLQWSSWMQRLPKLSEGDILTWYLEKWPGRRGGGGGGEKGEQDGSEEDKEVEEEELGADALAKIAQKVFRNAVEECGRGNRDYTAGGKFGDPLTTRVSEGMRYVDWLLKKAVPDGNIPDKFTGSWFTQLGGAKKDQQQLARGLKEHNILLLFRFARYDLAQNLGLFLVALMDRWVSLATSNHRPHPSVYTDSRSRYGICCCILFFCMAVMLLDTTLQGFWGERFKLSEEKMVDWEHAKRVLRDWEARRRRKLLEALVALLSRVLFLFGAVTLTLWFLVENLDTAVLYFGYVIGYTSVILFQFNRCFTTDVAAHVTIVFASSVVGLVTGVVLHCVPATEGSLYNDVLALVIAGVLSASLTFVWAWNDFSRTDLSPGESASRYGHRRVWVQRRLTDDSDPKATLQAAQKKSPSGAAVKNGDGGAVAVAVGDLLRKSVDEPNHHAQAAVWSAGVVGMALSMWTAKKVVVVVSNRSEFRACGLGGASSFARMEGTVLKIWMGMMAKGEVTSEAWQSLLSTLIAEAVLYHAARSHLEVGHLRALHTEHFLVETIGPLSRRIDYELSLGDIASLFRTRRRTNAAVLTHLCLGLSVDTEWDEIPEAGREAIVARIVGEEVPVSREMVEWMQRRGVELDTSDFMLDLSLAVFRKSKERYRTLVYFSNIGRRISSDPPAELRAAQITTRPRTLRNMLDDFVRSAAAVPVTVTKWIAVVSGGGSDIERELWYCLRKLPLGGLVLRFSLLIWKACWLLRNFWLYLLLVYRRRALARFVRLARRGASRAIHEHSVVVELPGQTLTGFASEAESEHGGGAMVLRVYDGALGQDPAAAAATAAAAEEEEEEDGQPKRQQQQQTPLFRGVYDCKYRLTVREDMAGGLEVTSTYHYGEDDKGPSTRWPVSKEVAHDGFCIVGFYDKYGRIADGTLTLGETEFVFKYYFKSTPRGSSDVLRADFRLAGGGCGGRSSGDSSSKSEANGDMLSVFWGVPVRADCEDDVNWTPSERVCRIVRRIQGRDYITTGEYQHRRDPVIRTVVRDENGTKTAVGHTPQVFPEEQLLMTRPSNLSFDNDDLLIYHRRSQVARMRAAAAGRRSSSGGGGGGGKPPTTLARALSVLNPASWLARYGRTTYRRVPTWKIRTELWNNWLKTGTFDAVTACWLDELVLREEPLLRPYWRARDSGRLVDAKRALDGNIDQIVSAIEIETEVSEVCLLPIRPSDLYAMGLGKDATQVTNRPEDCFDDTDTRISVVFNDIGCWPEAPGGVSNCRRDLVDGHSTIRNHVLAECANDFGIPRFQIEKNVQSIKLLPLWGLDGKTAHHGLIDNLLQSQVDEKVADTHLQRDVMDVFVPLLKSWVKGARTRRFTRDDLVGYSNTMLSLSKYLEHKDYNATWEAKEAEQAWVEAWLTPYHDPDKVTDPARCFPVERPSMADFRDALGIYLAYFFIFSVQVPKPGECPRVFQSTHHGISSLFGMLLKYRRGTTFGIWDHAILWRECCLNISPAQCTLAIPVQSMLLAGVGLATRLAYFHADVIMPCTSLFNPMWETEIGTDKGKMGSRNQFVRKIDPIVNGISNMESFTPVDKVRTDKPTVVMLSNVQSIKGIKTAILAADIIVNRYGFRDYRLVVYGAKDRQPAYALEMAKLIVERNLSENVNLAGFGTPKEVLKDAWLFMNSSISEGLPLAIGEAALAGVPIVATEVGATALVLTDPNDANQRYGEVVPPNDALALGRAQISILSMVGPWTKFTTEDDGGAGGAGPRPPPVLPDAIGPAEVEWLSRRMYARAGDRRELGLRSREVVLHSFHGNRYLREHEQMYWIQWHHSRMREDEMLTAPGRQAFLFGRAPPLRYVEGDAEEKERAGEELELLEEEGEGEGEGECEGEEMQNGVRPASGRRWISVETATEAGFGAMVIQQQQRREEEGGWRSFLGWAAGGTQKTAAPAAKRLTLRRRSRWQDFQTQAGAGGGDAKKRGGGFVVV